MRLLTAELLRNPGSVIGPSIERMAIEICRVLAAPNGEPQPARSALSSLINEPWELDAALDLAVANKWVWTDGARYEITASGMVVAASQS